MRIDVDSWNIIQKIIRRYGVNEEEKEKAEKGTARYERLIRETAAVETAMSILSPEEQSVVKERFWSYRDKNKSYEDMFDQPYSPRQMRRICYKMIIHTGKELGEI